MKYFTKYLVLGIAIFAAVVFVRTFTRAAIYSFPEEDVSADTIVTETDETSWEMPLSGTAATVQKKLPPKTVPVAPTFPGEYPMRLSIPEIQVDAAVQYVGVNAKGNMGIPTNYRDVAWFKNGIVPGEKGSAVIAGHVNNGLGLAGVFKDVHELKRGNDIYVTSRDKKKLHFVVMDVEEFAYNKIPVAELFGAEDEAYIRLITCAGEWLRDEKTYDTRIIVTARLVE